MQMTNLLAQLIGPNSGSSVVATRPILDFARLLDVALIRRIMKAERSSGNTIA